MFRPYGHLDSDLIGMSGSFTIICKHFLGNANVRNHWSNPCVANVNHYGDEEIKANSLVVPG